MEKKKTSKKTATKTITKTTAKKPVTKKKVQPKQVSKKKRKKGFTLIELLAVIIILGVLMIIAIPSVTTYISNSRKSSYSTTASDIVSGARTLVNEGKLDIFDRGRTYYIPYEMIPMESGASTPYGEFKKAYVVVTYNGDGFDYYWTSTDSANMAIYLTYFNDLDADRVVSDVEDIPTSIAICGKNEIAIFDKTGNIVEVRDPLHCVEEQKSIDNDVAKDVPDALPHEEVTVCLYTNIHPDYKLHDITC